MVPVMNSSVIFRFFSRVVMLWFGSLFAVSLVYCLWRFIIVMCSVWVEFY
jgi:hypothetical protein